MAKFLKDTPVYIACPHCGKSQHPRLKWAEHHKNLKCKHCKKEIHLKEKPAAGMISATASALSVFERALAALQVQAKKFGKAKKDEVKQAKKAKKEKKGKKHKKKAKAAKKPAKKAAPRKTASAPAGSGSPMMAAPTAGDAAGE